MNEEHNDEYNLIDDMIDTLNHCRQDYYKLYEKDHKNASIRLRQNLEYIIQTSKKIKREALEYRKDIQERERLAKDEAKNEGYIFPVYHKQSSNLKIARDVKKSKKK